MPRAKWMSGFTLVLVSVGLVIAFTHIASSSLILETAYTPSLEDLSNLSVQFPAKYQQNFIHYATVDCPGSNTIRQMYVNFASFDTLQTSENPPSGTVIVMETHSARQGTNGRLVPTQLNNIFIREKRSGWQVNADSGEWQSAWYSPSGTLVSNSQGSCISCHTMVRDRDYLFTLPALLAAAQTQQRQHQKTEFGTSVCQ